MNKLSLICVIILSTLCMRTYAACEPETVIMPNEDTIERNLNRLGHGYIARETDLVEMVANQQFSRTNLTITTCYALGDSLFSIHLENEHLSIERNHDNASYNFIKFMAEQLWKYGKFHTYGTSH